MSRHGNKNKHNKGKSTPTNGRPSIPPHVVHEAPATESEPSISHQAKALHREATASAHSDDLASVEAMSQPVQSATTAEVTDTLRLARDAQELFLATEKRAQASLSVLQQQQNQLKEDVERHQEAVRQYEAAQKRLQVQQDEYVRSSQTLAESTKSHDVREQDLLRRAKDIQQREIAAEAGFLREQRLALTQIEEEANTLRKQLATLRQERATEAAAFEERLRAEEQAWQNQRIAEHDALRLELANRRTQHELELQGEREKQAKRWESDLNAQRAHFGEVRAQLETQREEQEEEQRRLERELRKVQGEQQLLDEDKQDLDRLVERKAAREIEHRDAQIKALSDRLDESRAERDSLDQQLRQRSEAERRFGTRTPENILREIDALKTERDQLKAQLATRPAEEAVRRLETLVAEQEIWQRERQELEQECLRLRHTLDKSQIGVLQLEDLRDQKSVLETSRKMLQDRLHELQEQVDSRLRESEGRSPFPACSAMDRDPKLQGQSANEDKLPNLSDFVRDLQHRMADALSGRRLYYSLPDLRCFVAGLAMSKLHILQGISGTGKTSLPLAFANAIGAHSSVIRVQASWRDRQDLIGHYNTFERRFHESEFLQALYLAQCPQHAGRLVLVVLDEMNLSHPEHYFADLLSLLEEPEEKQLLDLMDAPIPSAPAKLVDGRLLRLPSNVWFIGTANHDETTKGFADKTYDRAHVMELPRKPSEFDVVGPQARRPIGHADLMQAFRRAKKVHGEAVREGFQALTREIGTVLERDFRIAWGPRQERQASDFAPVVIGGGGSAAEAFDHLLATKVLRKLRDRHDTRADDLSKLKQQIEKAWASAKLDSPPAKSNDLLDGEIRRLGRGDE